MSWIITFTGRRFWALDPRSEDVCVEDVAHSLAYQCRYNGHTTRFYSVAEHCCLLASYVTHPDRLYTSPRRQKDDALTMLLHDAAEAYLPDMPRPTKAQMPEYRAADAALESVVLPALGCEYPLPRWAKMLDSRILLDERSQVVTQHEYEWEATRGLISLGVPVRGIPPHEAERWFLDLYSELSR